MSDRWLKFAFAILTFIILLPIPAFAEKTLHRWFHDQKQTLVI